MWLKFRWLLWLSSVVLIGNFVVLRIYGDALRSTNLFIVRGTVFYPLSWLNLGAGIFLLVLLIYELVSKKRA